MFSSHNFVNFVKWVSGSWINRFLMHKFSKMLYTRYRYVKFKYFYNIVQVLKLHQDSVDRIFTKIRQKRQINSKIIHNDSLKIITKWRQIHVLEKLNKQIKSLHNENILKKQEKVKSQNPRPGISGINAKVLFTCNAN